MTDKYEEVELPPNRVERIPNEDVRVGSQYFAEDAARDLEPSMGNQAEELSEHDGTETEEEVQAPVEEDNTSGE